MPPADIARKWIAREQGPEDGIPSWLLVVMDTAWTEALLGREPGSYEADPVGLELKQKRVLGTAFLDQLVVTPKAQTESGFGGAAPSGPPVLDGIVIDGPEAVCRHMEEVVAPSLQAAIASFPGTEEALREAWLADFRALETRLGPETLLVPYGGCQEKPVLRYGPYGYEHYFTFLGLYPEVQEEVFQLEGILAELRNGVTARAIDEEGLPKLIRVDHDMTSAAGTLVGMATLDRIWLPHFARAMRPMLERGIQLLWHCDGNVNEFVPRLLDVGFSGFQGFQYECGMDWPSIARMRRSDGEPLTVIAGASVTTTMVFGTPEDVRREVAWLVRESGETFLALGASSSICPGTPWANITALTEELRRFQEEGRAPLP